MVTKKTSLGENIDFLKKNPSFSFGKVVIENVSLRKKVWKDTFLTRLFDKIKFSLKEKLAVIYFYMLLYISKYIEHKNVGYELKSKNYGFCKILGKYQLYIEYGYPMYIGEYVYISGVHSNTLVEVLLLGVELYFVDGRRVKNKQEWKKKGVLKDSYSYDY